MKQISSNFINNLIVCSNNSFFCIVYTGQLDPSVHMYCMYIGTQCAEIIIVYKKPDVVHLRK